MRLRADHQLFLSYLVLIAGLTIAISSAIKPLLRGHLLGTIEGDLRRELVLGRAIYDDWPPHPPDSIAQMIGRFTGRRVTIVATDGTTVSDFGRETEVGFRAGDLRSRPEIRQALDAGEGMAIRTSGVQGGERLFLAIRSDRGEIIRLAAPIAEIDTAVAEAQKRIFALGLVGTLVAALFTLGSGALFTRPLQHIGDVARALAAGDLSRRARIYREDDLGDMANALNKLADELEGRLGQLEGERAEMQALIDSMSEGVLAVDAGGGLRRANPAARRIFSLGPYSEGIAPEVVSRRPDFLALVSLALQGETVPPRELAGDGHPLLATAHPLPDGGAVLVFLDISELRRLEGVRRDFVANASHELKTPLTAIRGFSETLLDPELPPDLTRHFAEIVKVNADRLQRIVDDLLDLSRIEAGGWRVEPTLISLPDLVHEVWSAETSSDEGKVRLRLDFATGHETVWADLGAVRQIFANLFGNSLRYTPAGGSLSVRTREAPTHPGGQRAPVSPGYPIARWTLIEVADTGSGIPQAHLSRIFERFYRADPARSREEGGTGLGLAIVKHLIESHGGWIEAESRVGFGTTIRFTLPSESEEERRVKSEE